MGGGVKDAGRGATIPDRRAGYDLEVWQDRGPSALHASMGFAPNLVAELKEHNPEVIQMLREDKEYRRTGIIQCERRVFDLAQD